MIVLDGITGASIGELGADGVITTTNSKLAATYAAIKDAGGVLVFVPNPEDKTIARDYTEFVEIGSPNYLAALVEYLVDEGYDIAAIKPPVKVTLKMVSQVVSI